jgi:ABC-type uncharacterized transport system substrate-binding protein
MFRGSLHLLICAVIAAAAAFPQPARAHPHVWVTVVSEMIYAADGTLTGIRHHWTFDDMFSAFAIQGLDTNNDGKFSREELQNLAEVNVTSLKDFDYFTHAKSESGKMALTDPKEYWLEHANSKLTLHFTLPVKTPVKAKSMEMDIYDTSFFVDFTLQEKDAVTLVGAPVACTLASSKKGTQTASKPLSESFFNSLGPTSSFGSQFANKVAVTCP